MARVPGIRKIALPAGRMLKAEGLIFDVAYTSLLKRAIRTLWITLDQLDLMWIPVHTAWRLNERHYGALQGLNKVETAATYGETQIQIWLRSYNIPPPALTIRAGQRVIIVAHGNSLRALVKYLDHMSAAGIVDLNIPTGVPLVYELDADLKPSTHYYLVDLETIRMAQETIAQQGHSTMSEQ